MTSGQRVRAISLMPRATVRVDRSGHGRGTSSAASRPSPRHRPRARAISWRGSAAPPPPARPRLYGRGEHDHDEPPSASERGTRFAEPHRLTAPAPDCTRAGRSCSGYGSPAQPRAQGAESPPASGRKSHPPPLPVSVADDRPQVPHSAVKAPDPATQPAPYAPHLTSQSVPPPPCRRSSPSRYRRITKRIAGRLYRRRPGTRRSGQTSRRIINDTPGGWPTWGRRGLGYGGAARLNDGHHRGETILRLLGNAHPGRPPCGAWSRAVPGRALTPGPSA